MRFRILGILTNQIAEFPDILEVKPPTKLSERVDAQIHFLAVSIATDRMDSMARTKAVTFLRANQRTSHRH